MFLAAFLIPLMVLNSVLFAGMSVNLSFLAALFFIRFKERFRFNPHNIVLISFAVILLLKAAYYGSFQGALALKLAVVFVFFNLLINSSTRREQLYRGFMAGIAVSVAYAIYQMAIVYLHLNQDTYMAVLPVRNWNSNLWHTNLDRWDVIRVSGFAPEPAYLNIFLGAGLIMYLANKAGKKWHLLALLVGFALSVSRNGIVFLAFILTIYPLLRYLNRWAMLMALFLSYALPVLAASLINLSAMDSSVASRAMPIRIFALSDSLSTPQRLLGVNNYSTFISNTAEFKAIEDPAIAGQIQVDPTSFIGVLLYDYGILGVSLLFITQAWNFRNSKFPCFGLATFNIICFNVNVLYWPVYWALYYYLIDSFNEQHASSLSSKEHCQRRVESQLETSTAVSS